MGLLVSGCGQAATDPQDSAGAGFPMTFENCGEQVTIDRPPERVVLLQDGAVSLLAAVGALDKVVSIAGKRTGADLPEEIRAQVDRIPGIGSPGDAQEVSVEAIIAQRADVLIGSAEGLGLTRETLSTDGVPVIELPTLCGDTTKSLQNPTFDDIYPQVEFYGRLFGNENRAAATVTDLRGRVAAIKESAQKAERRTAAALFVSGGVVSGAYGAGSMQDAQMEILGLANVLGDIPGRFIEPSAETVISLDPDLIIAVIDFDDIGKAGSVVRSLPGYAGVTAVRNDEILELPFQFTDPPTPLSVVGLERIAKFAAP
ncbi:MAG: ABC transporter substrate-binding protein [Pseudonocardia sp.]